MNITQKEAIQLIIDFFTPLHGFWKEIPIKDALITDFIACGYAELDEEKGKYEISESGVDFLFPYIEQIANDFILFISQREFCCFDEETIEWFSTNYGIDKDDADTLYVYIVKILKKFGYKETWIHQKGRGEGYSFEKV